METDKSILETMVSVLHKLEDKGYTSQFQATGDGLLSLKTNMVYSPPEIKVDNFYRFEGESNPDDSSIVYAISTQDGEKGTLTDSYGRYSDENVAGFMRQVEEITKQVNN